MYVYTHTYLVFLNPCNVPCAMQLFYYVTFIYVDLLVCLVSFHTGPILLYIDSGCVDLAGVVGSVFSSYSFALFISAFHTGTYQALFTSCCLMITFTLTYFFIFSISHLCGSCKQQRGTLFFFLIWGL